ncbi:MAG: sulfatase-like hydrolase/transferase [Acidobacteriaceae bacterium]|jgi:arylsulfatase A-like enzyme|nr:sulfatase-like hydrolase/transferase [Acidobacteriaceae bacterium]
MTLSRRVFLATVPAAVGLGQLSGQRRARRPNVVVILTDDQGWGDLSLHGNSNLSTPRIDSIGRDGAQFERFYVCPVCAPTRAEFLTGRYHPRGGVRGVSTGQERLNVDEHTIAQTFRAAGYATGAFGKWHNGSQAPYHPNFRGFEEFYGFTSGHWAHYFDTEMDHNGQFVKGRGYITDDLTERAMAFVSQKRSRPFFCYLPLNAPHSPMQVPDAYYNRFANLQPALRATDPAQEDLAMTRAALAMVENIDWNVGRLLDRLKERRLDQDTIVVFFCDNGPNSWRWNGGMKGRKGTVDEGGVRSPLLVRWPRRIAAGRRIKKIAGAIDLLPTLAALAGVPVGSGKTLDGVSLEPLLTGRPAANWPDRMLFSHWNRRISVRTQRHRLDAEGRLFDLVSDPGQSRDIAAEEPAEAARLRAAAAAWGREMLPLVGPDDRPFPVGHARLTYLPARDGLASGGIRRSNTAPNSSYFTNWTQTGDRIFWNVEVVTPGAYEAVLHYTAPAAGSVVELRCGSARVESAVPVAHDPPAVGAAQDRHDRGQESYAKDFRRWSLGMLTLAAGRNAMTLRALRVAGGAVAEVRYLVLSRLDG